MISMSNIITNKIIVIIKANDFIFAWISNGVPTNAEAII